MQISRELKLVLPIYGEDEEMKLTVFVEPISRLVFEAHYRIMAKTWSDLNSANIGAVGLMTTASFALKDAAIELYGQEKGEARYKAFMAEVMNGAKAVVPLSGSWQPTPYENAVSTGHITDDDAAVVESLIAFFTLACRMVDPYWGKILRTGLQLNYGAQFATSSFTEYLTTLPTLATAASSGEKAAS